MAPIVRWIGGAGGWLLLSCIFGIALVATIVIPITALRSQYSLANEMADNSHKTRASELAISLERHTDIHAALSSPATMLDKDTELAPYILPRSYLEVSPLGAPSRLIAGFGRDGCEVSFQDGATVCFAIGLDGEVLERLFIGVKFRARRLLQYRLQSATSPPPFALSRDPRDAHRIELNLNLGEHKHQWILPVQTNFVGGDARNPKWNDPAISAYRSLSDQKPIFTTARITQTECGEKAHPDVCTRETYFSAVILRDVLDKAFHRNVAINEAVGARLTVRVLEPVGDKAARDRAVLDTSAILGAPKVTKRDIEGFLEPGERLTLSRATVSGGLEPVLIASRAPGADPAEDWLERLGTWSLWKVADLTARAPAVDKRALRGMRLNLALKDPSIESVLSFAPSGTINSRLAKESGLVVALGAVMFAAVLALALVVAYLLRRVAAEAARERERDRRDRERSRFELRREHERATFEAILLRQIRHEVRSPLSSLAALLDNKEKVPNGPLKEEIAKYVKRMTRAIELFSASRGQAPTPSSFRLEMEPADLVIYLREVAANAGAPEGIGVSDVVFVTTLDSALVKADLAALDDVLRNILENANRYRLPGTSITLSLTEDIWEAVIVVHNQGPQIPEEKLDRIFDFKKPDNLESEEHMGLGLFMAAIYMNKMDGSIGVRNTKDGVAFDLRLRRADA